MNTPELVKKEFSIGRNQGLADIFVNSELASDRHAKVSIMDNGALLLEDLRSSNGTFVNGERIRSKVVTLEDKIKIGDKEFLLREHFRTENNQIKSFRPLNDFTVEFARLKPVFLAYQLEKEKIKTKQSTTRFLRSTVPIVTPLIGVAFSVSNISEKRDSFMTVLPTILSVLLGVFLAWLLDSPSIQKRREQHSLNLDAEHRRKFICPKCQQSFERATWDQIAVQKGHKCGAILAR